MPHAKVKIYDAGVLLVPKNDIPLSWNTILIYSKRFRSGGMGGWNLTIKEFQYHLKSLLLLEDCIVELTDEKDTFSWTDEQTSVRVLTGDGREGFAFLHFCQRTLAPIS